MSVEVRQAHESDRPAIAAFIEEAYGERARFKGDLRWTWQFRRNPFGDVGSPLLPVCIASDGERVVGQIAVQPAALQLDGVVHKAGWIVDVMILDSHRGLGLGHRLHEGAARIVPILVTLTMAPATRRIAERGGAVTLGPVKQYSRLVRLDASTVRRYLLLRSEDRPRLHALVQTLCRLRLEALVPLLANTVLRLRDAARPVPVQSGTTDIVEIESFGPEFDDLWSRTRGDYRVIFPRDRTFLNWRFVDAPDLEYRRFVARRGGQAVGYVVLRRSEPLELPQGIVADLYASRSDRQTLVDLVRHSIAFFGREVAAIECAASIPEVDDVLRRHGFFAVRTKRPTVVCEDETLQNRIAELRDSWFFSKGDHDWDQIHVA
jgi:hypothetical protein